MKRLTFIAVRVEIRCDEWGSGVDWRPGLVSLADVTCFLPDVASNGERTVICMDNGQTIQVKESVEAIKVLIEHASIPVGSRFPS